MTFGWKDFSVARTDGGAHVFGLAGFLRDDDLIGHAGSFRRIGSTEHENIQRTQLRRKLHLSREATNLDPRRGSCGALRTSGLPPEKWSSLMYGFKPDGGLENVAEETQGGGDRREAAAG